MLSGRFTFGLGQVDTFPAPFGQTAVMQTAPAQWGLAEWAVVLTLGYIAISVVLTTKRAFRRRKRAAYSRMPSGALPVRTSP
jgi:hypothetical protein